MTCLTSQNLGILQLYPCTSLLKYRRKHLKQRDLVVTLWGHSFLGGDHLPAVTLVGLEASQLGLAVVGDNGQCSSVDWGRCPTECGSTDLLPCSEK